MSYSTILTAIGAATLTNAYAAGLTINLTHLALGDGNGSPITPTESMTSLVHEIHRVPVSALSIDAENPAWLIAEAAIPASIGGWTVREIGLFDDDGHLVAVGNFPDTYKPLLAEGSARDLLIRMIIQTSNASVVNLTIDPSVVIATAATIVNAIAAHSAADDPHIIYAKDSDLAAHVNSSDPHPAYALDTDVTAHNTSPTAHADIRALTATHNEATDSHADIRVLITKANSGRYFYAQI
jgi:phage-related tail fiber protein